MARPQSPIQTLQIHHQQVASGSLANAAIITQSIALIPPPSGGVIAQAAVFRPPGRF